MFFENYSDATGPRSNPWQERISSYHKALKSNLQDRPESISAKFSPRNVKYTGILSLLTHDLVGLVVERFSLLGCHHVEGGGARFFLSGLVQDNTQAMFDTTPPGPSPLADYGTRQITQMVDVWFSVHPLSFVVSKTLLLRELRDGTHDEILLATMLADANFSIGDEVAMARGHVLLRWAAAQLKNRPLPSKTGSDQSGMPPPGISLPGISTAQALMLLGWNAMCQYHIRRASCYIGLAGRLATEMKDQISSTSTPLTTSRINGIDVFDVSKELVSYLWWTTYTLTLWTFMQMGHNFSQLLPTSLTSIFLPVDETTSMLIRLDEVSDNFSTLQKQKAMIREMFPLAHIASVVAHVYNLYPQEPEVAEAPSTQFWQEAPLLALQRIQQGSSPNDVACVSREVYRVLMESIHLLQRQVGPGPSRSLVLVVYHTMAIHLLFPHQTAGALPPIEPNFTTETIERFCTSAHEIITLFAQVSEQSHDLLTIAASQSQSSFPDILCLALDTCARAMSYIHHQRKCGGLAIEGQLFKLYEERLETLANKMHTIAQSDILNPGSSLRVVKKQLKAIMGAFGGHVLQRVSHSGMATPDNSRRMSSLPHSPPITHTPEGDHLSTATTTVVDSASSFVSPLDTTPFLTASESGLSNSGPGSGIGADNVDANAISTPPNLFSHLEHAGPIPGKPDWRAAEELFHHVMDTSSLGAPPTTGSDLSVPDLVDLHHSWFPANNQMMMDFDMTGGLEAGMGWDWPSSMGNESTAAAPAVPAVGGTDMDAVLYYLDRSENKGS
jgi:hypothetical protein